jgi:fatty-acyl-CoA synthase
MSRRILFPARPDPIRDWAAYAPDRIALVDRARDLRQSYRELDREISRWTVLLSKQGVTLGQRVAVLAGNRPEVVALLFACHRLGAALVPLNWRLPAAELTPILQNAEVALLVYEGTFRTTLEATTAGLDRPPRVVDLDAATRLLTDDEAGSVPIEPETPALVLYTSGTTGKPKGAVLPHRQLFYNAVATATAWELTAADVGPISTPFFHTGGWNVFALPVWHRGGRVVLFEKFEPLEFLAGMAEEGCTVALTVPTQLVMLLESPEWGRPVPSLRAFWVGGAPCPQSLQERVRAAGYRLREGYGLTECGPNCFVVSDEEARRRPGWVGRPMLFLSMRLVREDDSPVEEGEPGELQLRGPQVFSGYLHDPARSAEAFTADGWLRTGDLAQRSSDGCYRICGRRKEMFISGGENVFPAEVEAALADHPGVVEVAVIGVPDPRWGEVGRAFVVPRAGSRLAEATVIEHARLRLAGYKVPRSIVLLPALPRLGSGKVDRDALQGLGQ